MHARLLIAARVLTWAIALGAVAAVVISYQTLPDELPLTRWTMAPKSPLIALRVPLINLLTVGLVELLSLALLRAEPMGSSAAVAVLLMLTAAVKAAVEAIGLWWPDASSWTLIIVGAVVFIGCGTAAFVGRKFLHPQRWQRLQLTRFETAGAILLVVGIVALNLPLVLR